MKRRDLLKSCLLAPFAGLLKGKKKPVKYEVSGDSTFSGPSLSSSSMGESNNIIYRYVPISDFNKVQIPLDTHIYPSYNHLHKFVGIYWSTEEIGKI